VLDRTFNTAGIKFAHLIARKVSVKLDILENTKRVKRYQCGPRH
jgi:hypothetical protein